jgi:hypothetical protein
MLAVGDLEVGRDGEMPFGGIQIGILTRDAIREGERK